MARPLYDANGILIPEPLASEWRRVFAVYAQQIADAQDAEILEKVYREVFPPKDATN